MIPEIAPVLAERGAPTSGLADWSVEPKLDGWRVTVLVDPSPCGGVAVRTRRGHGITDTVPGIAALAASAHRLVLDGELVAGAGRASDFYALAPRGAGLLRRPAPPVSIWAFDLLWLDGDLLIDRPLRRAESSTRGASPARALRRRPSLPRPRRTRSPRRLRRARR
jgi:ATP-dependent DNA ligase